MEKVYILAAKRSAIGTFMGTLKNTGAVELGAEVTKVLLEEGNVKPSDVNEIIFGNVLSTGLGQNAARQIAIKIGVPVETPAFTINKVCGSGMKAIDLAYQSILLGNNEVVIAGGTENMNQAPYFLKGAREGFRMGNSTFEDSMIKDGLTCSINDYHMGFTAENLAKKYNISREEQDAFAFRSQEKAAKAIEEGRFQNEIAPVQVKRKKELVDFAIDEHPRLSSLEKLADLKPAFDREGTVTAANASGINDGAAVLLLAGENFVRRNGLSPMAEIIGIAASGVDPKIMGIGPASSIMKLLKKTNTELKDIDLFELNEAFAVQSLAVLKETGIDAEMVNVNGGAIALGHPIGASGSRIMVTLLHEMKKRGLKTGLASLCIGGGMGISAVIKMEGGK